MKHSIRSKVTGQFVPRSTVNVVNGRLYDYNGVVVRARKLCANGLRMVSYHKKLNGFVRDEELKPIDSKAVARYLSEVLKNNK